MQQHSAKRCGPSHQSHSHWPLWSLMSQYSGNDNLQLHSAEESWKTNSNLLYHSVWKTDPHHQHQHRQAVFVGVWKDLRLWVWRPRHMPFSSIPYMLGPRLQRWWLRQAISFLSMPSAYPGSHLHDCSWMLLWALAIPSRLVSFALTQAPRNFQLPWMNNWIF